MTSLEDYAKAQKLAQKSHQKYLLEGKYPYLQVLEELLSHTNVVSEEKLGVIQIPADRIVGTFTAGRRTAFAPNFMPLLERQTEFAMKWTTLCEAHLSEGIREPIKAYEFMNRYYVVEGNKRVSVLKYFNAISIPGNVTRLIPKRTEEEENRVYFEYLDFSRKTGISFLYFNHTGCYKRAAQALEISGEERLSEDAIKELHSAVSRFTKAYEEKGGENPVMPVHEALLVYLEMYSYQELKEKLPQEIREDLDKIWEEILLQTKDKQTEILLEPSQAPKKNFFERLLQTDKSLKIAFIHDKNKENSAWTYAHELGRMYLEESMEGKAETICFDNVMPGESLEKAFEAALEQKCDIIFTTTPQFFDTSLKMAIRHPEVKILNCSPNPSHVNVRTYYARLYEAKFLAGVIAGSLSPGGKIGYMADYPICGMVANINAFAIGAKMVNPRAKVYLEWTSVKSREEILKEYKEKGVSMVSCQEMIVPGAESRTYGLINIEGEEVETLASAIWNWGIVYKRLVQGIQAGSWKNDDESGQALGYWWGMSADAIDIICSKKMPEATMRLVNILKKEICTMEFRPFSGKLFTQDSIIEGDEKSNLSAEKIINMDWLAENIIGSFPEWDSMTEQAKALVRLQGIRGEEEVRE